MALVVEIEKARHTKLPFDHTPRKYCGSDRGNPTRPRRHTEEFYQVTSCWLDMKKLNRELRDWERIYNTVRPHQALDYLTPRQFLSQLPSQRKE